MSKIAMIGFLTSPTIILLSGLLGGGACVLSALVAAIAYRGRCGERYSPLNHFISELGEVGISRLAWLFNLGLFLGGLLLLPECIGLGLLIPGVWSKLGMITGLIAAVAVMMVGVFPMNNIRPHMVAADTFFRAGLLMVFFFTIAIAFPVQQPPSVPRLFFLAGVPATLAYSYFLVYSRTMFQPIEDGQDPFGSDRPRLWRLALSEWSIFLTTVPWFLVVAFGV